MLRKNSAMAEDLIQGAFLREWREERKAKSWLITTLCHDGPSSTRDDENKTTGESLIDNSRQAGFQRE